MPIYALDDLEPSVDDDAFIADTAVLIGRVEVAADASVWWGSVLRGDNEPIRVGRGSNVQDQCVLHTDPGCPLEIGPGATIGHRVALHGCRIGAGALVGIGAVVLNRAEVGEGALIGAHALVTEGTVIPSGTLALGAPARVVRALSDAERARLAASAERYVANAARYRSGARRMPDSTIT